jgi:hypothetical protein
MMMSSFGVGVESMMTFVNKGGGVQNAFKIDDLIYGRPHRVLQVHDVTTIVILHNEILKTVSVAT